MTPEQLKQRVDSLDGPYRAYKKHDKPGWVVWDRSSGSVFCECNEQQKAHTITAVLTEFPGLVRRLDMYESAGHDSCAMSDND
jgi:hypothetical protein